MLDSHALFGYEEFARTAPAVRAALLALSQAVDASGLEKELTELVKLRVSQINNCSFCVQFHLNVARGLGVAQEKLDLVTVWRGAGIFSAREMAAFAWAECVTAMAGEESIAAGRVGLLRHFSSSEALYLTVAIGTINQWNRIATAFGFPPPIPRRAPAKS